MIHRALDRAHRLLARSAFATRTAVLIRNQCGQIIGYRLGESNDFDHNGERLLLRTIAARCQSALDVGANIGEWTSAFLSVRGSEPTRMLLFEPQRRCADTLRKTVGLRQGIEIVEAAVGDHAGTYLLHESENPELASLVDSEGRATGTRAVPVTTLDEELHSRNWEQVDLVKVDAEGFDLHVLRGARDLLEARNISCVQFEYNRSWAAAGSTLADAYRLLRECGYEPFLLRSTGLFELRASVYGEYFAYSNFVALAPDCLPWVEGLLRGAI